MTRRCAISTATGCHSWLLALGAVIFTTAAVAFVGWKMAGLPIAAAIALGAIVAPPDAVAASAVLGQFKVPHRITAILQGESLLNDATALLIYRLAVSAALGSIMLSNAIPTILLSTIGSLVAGYVLGRFSLLTLTRIEDAASSTVVQFAGTFGVWILADKLGLSAIITIVVYAMTIARTAPRLMSAQEARQHLFGLGVGGVRAQRAGLRADGLAGTVDRRPVGRGRAGRSIRLRRSGAGRRHRFASRLGYELRCDH